MFLDYKSLSIDYNIVMILDVYRAGLDNSFVTTNLFTVANLHCQLSW